MGNDDHLLKKYAIVADAGKVIFNEADVGNHMFIIKSGSIKISKMMDGKEMTLAILQKGDFFGEMALVSNNRRNATATSVSTTELLVINRSNFIDMVQKNGKIALNIIEKLCKRIQHTNQQLKVLAERDTKAIFAQNLYYAFHSEDSVNNSIPYLDFFREMTLSLEIPQDTLSHLLQTFKSQGIIDIMNAKIMLLDEERLKELGQIEQFKFK